MLHYLDFGRKGRPDCLLRVTFKRGAEDAVQQEIEAVFRNARLLNRVTDFEEEVQTRVYGVRLRDPREASALEERLRSREDVSQVAVYEGDQQEGDG